MLVLKFSCVKSLLSGQSFFGFSKCLMGNLGIKTLTEIFGCLTFRCNLAKILGVSMTGDKMVVLDTK